MTTSTRTRRVVVGGFGRIHLVRPTFRLEQGQGIVTLRALVALRAEQEPTWVWSAGTMTVVVPDKEVLRYNLLESVTAGWGRDEIDIELAYKRNVDCHDPMTGETLRLYQYKMTPRIV